MKFELGNLSVERGQKVTGFLQLPFSEDALPTTLIYGKEDGPTVLVTGGIHNAEYVGIEAAKGLANQLEADDIKGILIIISIVNVNGFKARTISVSAEGTYTDQLAYFIEKTIYSKIDYYIDVHNGDWFEDLTPFIYAIGKADPEVAAKAEAMARCADVPFYVKSGSDSGGAYNYAGRLGIPAVLLERGCLGMWSEAEAAASRKDVRNILRHLGLLISDRFSNDHQQNVPKFLPHVHYIDSEEDGCWFPQKKAGDIVMAGHLIGVLKDYFGSVI